MTWYDPATYLDFAAGEFPTAAKLDKIGSNFYALRNELPYCIAYQDSQVPISPNTWTAVPLNQESHNADIHDNVTNNTLFIFIEAGVYHLHAQAAFQGASNFYAIGIRFVKYHTEVQSMGTQIVTANSFLGQSVNTSIIQTFEATSKVEMQVWHNTDIDPLNTLGWETYMFAHRIAS